MSVVLATEFASPAFPFISYKTGDVGVWSDASHTCACGRQSHVLLRIEGCMDDCVMTSEGRRIMRFDYVFKDTTHVKESQIVQRHEDPAHRDHRELHAMRLDERDRALVNKCVNDVRRRASLGTW